MDLTPSPTTSLLWRADAPVLSEDHRRIILEGLAHGRTLTSLAAELQISPVDMLIAVEQDEQIANDYRRARNYGYLLRADELRDLVLTRPKDQVEATWQRTAVNALQWELSKLLPKTYGDKVQHEVAGVVLQVVTGLERKTPPVKALEQTARRILAEPAAVREPSLLD